MMVARFTIDTHLKHLKKIIRQAEKYKKMVDKKRFLTDQMAQDAVCRTLQLMIEAGLTIGEMIIAENDLRKPEKNDDIFDILAEGKIYPRSFAEELWGAGGFRNILTHNYVDLNLDLVYDNLEKGIPVFKKYAQYIAKFLLKK
ncbi:DUF86 domain-containing protein [Candidatus Parcubacteria bacterium]|nr:DUF86 domain-containing protein [Candidatus Parcubacteria bacterium]